MQKHYRSLRDNGGLREKKKIRGTLNSSSGWPSQEKKGNKKKAVTQETIELNREGSRGGKKLPERRRKILQGETHTSY